jgi:hypothetical protein
MKELVEAMIKKDIHTTYTAALQAMALQKINPKKYQWRIAQCAQFLVENQCENGQWDYGEKIVSDFKPPKEEPPTISTDGEKKPAAKKYNAGQTQRLPQIPVPPKRKKGPPNGDNSNAQYAALGLRACIDAGLVIPRETLVKAREWWTKSQNQDGGWGYNGDGSMDGGGIENETGVSNASYGSMSAGAVGALCIYKHYLGETFKSDMPVLRGLDWLTKNYDVKKNPFKKNFAYLYYLYALERAGLLYGTEKFGAREWYPEGAHHLLDTQKANGEWNTADAITHGGIADTCFAILFLRRGTTPLVPQKIESGGGKKK